MADSERPQSQPERLQRVAYPTELHHETRPAEMTPPRVHLGLSGAYTLQPAALLALQRTAGNRAVQRLIAGAHLHSPAALVQRVLEITKTGDYFDENAPVTEDTKGLKSYLNQAKYKSHKAALLKQLNAWASDPTHDPTKKSKEGGPQQSITFESWSAALDAALKLVESGAKPTQAVVTKAITKEEESDDEPAYEKKEKEEQEASSDYYPEDKLYTTGKHGIQWKEARSRMKLDGLPQGKFGSKADVDFLIPCAKLVGLNSVGFFELYSGHTCTVLTLDQKVLPAEIVFVKVYENGKIHGYPLLRVDKKDNKPIQKSPL